MADVNTGRELRQFFVELLLDGNLADYTSNRETYVQRQRVSGIVSDTTMDLILTGSLAEIEDNIKLVTGSRHAVPLLIVWPPM